MKRLSMLMMCLFAMMAASLSAKAQEITINLRPGWNWIGYPNAMSMELNDAFGDFLPMEGDVVKSEFGFAEYNNGNWVGSLTHFMPGKGYMYCSRRTEETSFVFRGSTPQSQVFVTTSEPTTITTTSAVSGGSITSNDSSYIYVLQKGICWATHPNPMVMNDFFTENGSGAESFTAEMTGLVPNTLYYVRAYAVTASGTAYGEEHTFVTLEIPVGAIDGLFSVSASQQVYFSQGNLQYQASTNTWRFALNQWDYVGGYWYDGYDFYYEIGNVYENEVKCKNNLISFDYSGWIDLFGWGTSGYNHGAVCYHPWSMSTGWFDYYAYGQNTYNLYDQTGEADWGHNPIYNGGNIPKLWRTLTNNEWNYIFNIRTTVSGIRYAKANVNNVNGIVLLPDNWDASYYTLCNVNTSDINFSVNTITETQWGILEQYGAVFLPAAGRRIGTTIDNYGHSFGYYHYGHYWTASFYDDNYVYNVVFNDSSLGQSYDYRSFGESVRLVYPAE